MTTVATSGSRAVLTGCDSGQTRGVAAATKHCDTVADGLPMLTSITFRKDGSLWGTTWSLVPGMGDAVQILP